MKNRYFSATAVPLACMAFVVSLGGSAWAQDAAPSVATDIPSFRIRGFELTGDIPLPVEETTRILAPYISNQATIDTLQQASAALEKALKDKGYVLHRVVLPPQEVGDKVALTVVKFVIGRVVIEGAQYTTEQNIRASIPALQEGEAPSFKAMAVQMSIANENPSKQVQVSLKESEEPDRIDAKVIVNDSPALTGSLNANNTGTHATGNDRVTLAFNHNNVQGRDHQLGVALTSSMERSDAVRQLGMNYKVPLYRQGAVVGLAYTYSDVMGTFGTFQSTGAGQTLGGTYSHYFEPVGGRRSYLTLGLDYKLYNAAKVNGVVVAGQVDRVSTPLTVGYTLRKESDAAVWSVGLEWASHGGGGTGARLSDYQSEDGRIQSANWNAVRMNANYLGVLPKGWMWAVRAQVQYSADALISGEQFGLGGASSVRGTTERVISGDSGAQVSVEVQTPELVPGLRLLAFADGGSLSNNNAAASTALKPASDQLGSVGVGLRWNSKTYSVVADYARIVAGARQPLGGNNLLPKEGDDKIHVNVTARF